MTRYQLRKLVARSLLTLACLLLFSSKGVAAGETAGNGGDDALPTIPAGEQKELKAAGDAFVRQFCASDNLSEYRAAFEAFFARYALDKAGAPAKARELAASVSVGQVALKEEIGKPIQGEFIFVGSRRIGGRLLKIAYYRKYSLGLLPVELVFNKPDREWNISQVGFGSGTVGPDLSALWVHEPPGVLQQTITDFAKLRSSTDECMKALIRGETRPGIEALVKRWSQGAPTPSLLVEAMVKGVEGRPDLGKSLGYELLGTARQSDALCKLVYAWRFEKLHAPICFEYFKAGDAWLLWRARLFDDATPDLTEGTISEPAK